MSLTLSVIIPALNESASIQQAIRSAWVAGADEVILADGGSEDGTPDFARDLGCQVVTSRAGRGVQQNAGAAVAHGEILLFQHADSRLAGSCIDQAKEAGKNRFDVSAGAFYQRIEHEGPLYRWLERGNAARVRCRGLAYGDQGIFVRREIFQRVGGFANVPLMEDVILMRAIRRFTHPILLPGPIYVSPRRWQRRGLIRQTACNWCLLAAFSFGVSPETLGRYYPRHDVATSRRRPHQPS